MTKAFEKPSVMFMLCFVLGFVALFLPVTRIQYQIITDGVSTPGKSTITSTVGYSKMFGDQYGRDALPCRFAGFIAPNPTFNRIHTIWSLLGRALCIGLFSLLTGYLISLKLSLGKFTLVLVIFFAVIIGVMIVLNPDEPMCNPGEQYQIISFTPFWITFVILIGGILLGFRSTHLLKVSTVSGIPGTGKLQP